MSQAYGIQSERASGGPKGGERTAKVDQLLEKANLEGYRGKRVEKRQTWESKYKMDTEKQSQEITELKLKLRVEKIRRAELQAKN